MVVASISQKLRCARSKAVKRSGKQQLGNKKRFDQNLYVRATSYRALRDHQRASSSYGNSSETENRKRERETKRVRVVFQIGSVCSPMAREGL